MRTPPSRSRFRRPAAILVLLVLAAAAWIAATGLAGATTSGHRAAKLVLRSHDPATVNGTGFKARSRVRVTYVRRADVRAPPRDELARRVHDNVPDGRRPMLGVHGFGEPTGARDDRA